MTSPTSQDGPPKAETYRVLARKYRPRDFQSIYGQDALVRTLTNAIQSGRIAHAFMLTGVRGVGKTTTARIIARALNCTGPDGKGGPTVNPCGVCENCTAILADRHVDVMEMDAASRTGVDDIREIIEGVRYGPVQARYKVYIIDEVHMLSRNAFNALLKTLEEPPPHVKFIFATTEIRKVPITVLSRCQRFDLRRIDAETLTRLFTGILEQEGVSVEPDALALIARAADGSARDGLSLLDQAIALSSGTVTAAQVRDMLGLADRTRVIDLFEAATGGDPRTALDILADLHRAGADPLVVMQDLLDLTHYLTRRKVVGEAVDDATTPEAERTRGARLAERLSLPALARLWQMLLKGLGEVQAAPVPHQAAEMVIIRIAHAADLPDPGELVRRIQAAQSGNGATPAGNGLAAPAAAAAPSPEPVAWTSAVASGGALRAPMAPPSDEPQARADLEPNPADFTELVALFARRREGLLYAQLRANVHLVSFAPGRLEIRTDEHVVPGFAGKVSKFLTDWTGMRWDVVTSRAAGTPTLEAQEKAAEQARLAAAAEHPLVKRVLDAFPGAAVATVRSIREEPPVAEPAAPEPEAADDAPPPAYDEANWAEPWFDGEMDD